jgi:hypothetical protein
METPGDDLKADPGERETTPEFDALTPPDELVRGERTRDDVFDAVLQLNEPATVTDVAERADHGPDATREYLEWFERMGIVKNVGTSPATYRLNREYLTWRRVDHIRDEYSPNEIIDRLADETDRENEFTARFGVESPDQVCITDYAANTEMSIADVWMHLCDWRTTRRRITLLERALPTDDTLSPSHYRQPA